MRVRVPQVPANFAPEKTKQDTVSALTSNQQVIGAPPITTFQELQIPLSSAPRETLQQILLKTGKRTRNSSK